MLSRRGFSAILLILITTSATASILLTALAQTDIYLGLPPTPPTKRILYNWNESECWKCHYIPAPMPTETLQTRYTQKVSVSFEAEPGLRRLTSGPGNNIEAVWSPDGSRVVYTSDRFGNWTLHVINVESGEEAQLTSPDSINGHPDWSPAGDTIAFWSYRKNQSQIYTVNSDGTDERQLTSGSLLKGWPLWSPDGKRILFSQKDEYWQIWVMDLETSRQRRVSGAEEQNNHWAPIWMPDGKEILYYASNGLVLRGVDVESGHHRNLTFASVKNLPADLHPRISPDRTKILFNSLRSPNWGLWLMDIDGKNPTRLTKDGAGDRSSSWSPDGKEVLYSSYRSGNPDIWLMSSDGSEQTRLTESYFDDFSPSWHPSGERIAFESNRGGKFDIWILELNRPLEATVRFPKHSFQNTSSEAQITFNRPVESNLQIDSVRVHFDWQPSGAYEESILTPPVLLSPSTHTDNRTMFFGVPPNASIGYHSYDLEVKFRKTSAASNEPSWTYQHTAKDLTIDSLEKGVYEALHATVASEIEAQNRRAQKEGYSEPLIRANQELRLAERLAIDGRLAEAKEHLEISESFLKQNVPEEKLTQPIAPEVMITVASLSVIILALVFRRKLRRTGNSMHDEKGVASALTCIESL